MKSRYLVVMLGLMMLIAARPAGAQPQMKDYMTTPFWLEGRTVPLVMLVLERDWKMFYPAYNNLADLDGDGALDIGFNPNVTYVGYFDSNSCYEYKPSGSGNAETGFFQRVGPTTPQSQAQANTLATGRGIHNSNLVYPASVHGVCDGGSNTARGLGQWHGNWLNFALTSRMDAIRKVLYGGKRVVDDNSTTMLEMIRVPANANVWGGELYADDIWEDYAPSSPWYDISLFTGFNPPVSGTMHFWARADYYWNNVMYGANPTPSSTSTQQSSATQNAKPLFRVVTNIPSSNRHPFLKVPLRIWDWSGDHSSYNSIPSDGHLANSKEPVNGNTNSDGFMAQPGSRVAHHFAAQVKVCQAGNISESEGCRAYPYMQGGTLKTNYKPIGLLQDYGESERMFFGLLTGTISHPASQKGTAGLYEGYRYKGGVLRHHISDFKDYVNHTTYEKSPGTTIYGDGTIVRPGLIDTIDAFEITGVGSDRSYVDGSQAGNPLGEMVWEAVRYLGGGGKNPQASGSGYNGLHANNDYGPTASETQLRQVLDNKSGNLTLPKKSKWDGRPLLGGNANDCPKPVILAISEVIPDHDGDNYPRRDDFKNVPVASFITDSGSPITKDELKIDDYLKIITETDGLSTPDSGGKLFFYPDNRGLCSARELPNGLRDIVGHCPSEPSLEGTYNLAAVAYYAHTHDFDSLAGEEGKPTNIDFYAVGIPGNFPDITLTLDEIRSITLMPIAMTAPLDASSYAPEGRSDDAFRTLLNFFIEYWQTDDGTTRKIPYKVKFRTNFEFTTYPCFVKGGNSNNWERDLFNAVTITLLTDRSTDRDLREEEPLFINSGPFKTRDRDLYRTQRAAYHDALKTNPAARGDNYFTESGTQRYFYAFKKTKGRTLDISQERVVGVTVHSDSVGSGYGASGLTGYTITGVTFPGAYLDVGLNRSDYPIYYRDENGRPSKSTFVPNLTYAGPEGADEAVPLDPSGSGLPGAQWNYKANGTHARPYGPNAATQFDAHVSGYGSVYTNNNDCGFYHPPTLWDALLTPAECPYAGYTDTSDWSDPDLAAAYNPRPPAEDVCGQWAAGYSGSKSSKIHPTSSNSEGDLFRTSLMRYVQVRSFKFDTAADRPRNLPNPMWLAAKYGGFNDSDGNGIPNRDSEWKRNGSGVGADDPYNYFGVANMSELPTQLGNAFETIANSVATGTANASSISTVLGGGLSLQTQYRPDYDDPNGNRLKWVGAVYAFFVDKWGNLRADTPARPGEKGDRKLTIITSPVESKTAEWDKRYPTEAGTWYEKGDLIVHTVIASDEAVKPDIYLCRDIDGNNNGNTLMPTDVPYEGNEAKYPPNADCVRYETFEQAYPVWNAAEKLTEMGPDARRVYTYYDITTTPADGTFDWSTKYMGGFGINLGNFKFHIDDSAHLHKLMGQATEADTKDLVDYIRGHEKPKYRNRTAILPWDPDGKTGTPKTWIMGDVINSKPVIVGDASGNYHLLYGSKSYSDFKSSSPKGAYCYTDYDSDGVLECPSNPKGGASKRRQVTYFGSNGGMLHAVNLGFFGALKDGKAGYADDSPSVGYTELADYKNLVPGEELWAYVPTAVLPHLQWLADPEYTHGFFVDLEPYATDITDANGRWKTILLVGLRMGGRTIEVVNADTKPSYSYSEYFALDVTEPDSGPPKLLWRFAHPRLGLTTASPAVVRRADSSGSDEWYAILPSGPTSDVTGADGVTRVPSDLDGGLAYDGRSTQRARVFIVNARTGKLEREPDESDTTYPLVVPDDSGEMLEGRPYSERNSFFNDTFTPRAVYVPQGSGGERWSHHAVYMGLTATSGDVDSGALYRLQMANTDGTPLPVSQWRLARMYKTGKPVTGAVNSAYDSLGNLWVLFGTGRVWASKDLAPCGMSITQAAAELSSCCGNHDQYLFGLKEPLTSKGYMTFEEIGVDVPDKIVDVSRVLVYDDGSLEGTIGGLDILTDTVTNYDSLYRLMIRKTNAKSGYKRKLESWWMYDESEAARNFAKFEVITTQPKIDGLVTGRSNMVVTSYETSANICDPAGRSFLNVLDTYTGLPAPYMASYGGFDEARGMSAGRRNMSGLKKAGKGMASEAWVLKSGGSTIYGNTSFNSNRNMIYVDPEQAMGNAIVTWREVLDMGFDLLKNAGKGLYNDLKTTP